MLGSELALDAAGLKRWLYRRVGTLDIDQLIWKWHFKKRLFPELETFSEGRLLDAGCNKGIWSFYLLRRFPGLAIMGIDIQPDAIAFCRDVVRKHALENIAFETMAFQDLEFRAEFDVLISLLSLHYSYRTDQEVLKRFFLALKPGGSLFLLVPRAGSFFRCAEPASGDPAGEVKKYGISLDPVELSRHYQAEELDLKLRAAGFEAILIETLVGPLAQRAKRIYSAASRGVMTQLVFWPIAAILARLDHLFASEESGAYYLVKCARPGDG